MSIICINNYFQISLRGTIIWLTLVFIVSNASAQTDMSDLIRSLKTEKQDSTLLNIYTKITRYYQDANPDTAIMYLQQGIQTFTNNKYNRGIATLTSSLAFIDGMQGRLDVAKDRYTYALKLSKEENYSKGIAVALNGLGVVEGRKGNYEPATKYFLEALKEYERSNNEKGITNTYIKLAAVNDLIGNNEKAIEYNTKVIERSQQDPNMTNLLTAYDNLGVINFKSGNKDKALEYFNKVQKLSNKPEYSHLYINSLNNLGNYYINIEQPKTALGYFNKGLKLAKERGFVDQEIRFVLNIENIKSKLNPVQAIENLNKVLVMARKIGHKNLELEILDEILTIEAQTKQYKAAFDGLLAKNKLEDSINNSKKVAEINNLQSVFELEKSKAKVNQLIEAENRTKRERSNVLIIAIVLGLCLFGLSCFYRKSKILNKKLRINEADLIKSNSIKDRLFSIIGHDLRGPIANVPVMLDLFVNESNSEEERKIMLNALNENSQAALDTLDKLLYWGKSQIKGKSINQSNFNVNNSLEEILKLFNGLASYKQINIINHIKDTIDVFADPDHFNFIMRNLLSNAIKFTYSNGQIEIFADVNQDSGITTFSVKDNGIGINKDQQEQVFDAFNISTSGTSNEKGHSIGLMLCREFLSENGGQIWLESKKGVGTTIFFTLKNASKPVENHQLTYHPGGYQTAH